MTVMSWNVSDVDVTAPLDSRALAIVEYIRGVAPDVLCCQKLNSETSPSSIERGFELFGGRLGMLGRLAPARGVRLHTGVLWKREIVECRAWVALGDSAHRNAALATLRMSEDRVLQVGTVHLPSGSVEHRLDDVRRLLVALDRALPCVLAGDWNSVGQDPDYDPDPSDRRLDRRVAARLVSDGLRDAAHHLAEPWQPTWGHSLEGWPAVRIDCFWVDQKMLPALVSYEVDTSVDHLSLHRPILLRLDPQQLEPVATA